MSDDLSSFLLARIAEDEALLRRDERQPHSAHLNDLIGVTKPDICPTCRGITLLGQTRALAECQAKRRIVMQHGHWTGTNLRPADSCLSCDSDEPWPCLTLRLLVLPYSDHPDYREKWRP